jgi:hypothetical protein
MLLVPLLDAVVVPEAGGKAPPGATAALLLAVAVVGALWVCAQPPRAGAGVCTSPRFRVLGMRVWGY